MKFRQTSSTGGDGTAPYDVTEYKARTVAEFIDEVLKQYPNECGFFEAIGKRIGPIFLKARVEYRHNKVEPFPEVWHHLEIESVKAAGGWSRMDYYFTTKEEQNMELIEEEKRNFFQEAKELADEAEARMLRRAMMTQEECIKEDAQFIKDMGEEEWPVLAEDLKPEANKELAMAKQRWIQKAVEFLNTHSRLDFSEYDSYGTPHFKKKRFIDAFINTMNNEEL